MTELDRRLASARVRLTELQQDLRQGKRAEVLLGLLALATDLLRYVAEHTAEHLPRPR